MTEREVADCPVCGEIPVRLEVELLHTPERLPAAVESLTAIGGAGIYGAKGLRKCPRCSAYFSFLHDHDSEAGVGYGYTDEAVTRLDPNQARALATQAATAARSAIQYWKVESASGGYMAEQHLAEARAELERLEAELALLRARR